MPRLSILLPTYNGARYLPDQLDSISAQSDGDFEVVVVDDGSTDDTPAIVARHAGRDARFRVLPAAGNNGQTARLAQCLHHAGGELIGFADQDDVWDPYRNARLIERLGARAAAFGTSDLIDGAGDRIGMTLLERLGLRYTDDCVLLGLFQPMFSAHAMIVRRDRINPAAFFQPFPFDWALALEAIFSDGIAHVPDATVFHRMHDANQMNVLSFARRRSRVSVGDLRSAFLYRRLERLRLWLVTDYLAKSPLLVPERRRAFRTAAGVLAVEWFSAWRSIRGAAAGKIAAAFAGVRADAGSPADAAAFDARLAALSGSPVGPAAVREGRRKLALIRA